MWPFKRKPKSEARQYLDAKFADPTLSREGRDIIREATRLEPLHPELSGPELIRLAYWGTPGAFQ